MKFLFLGEASAQVFQPSTCL